MIKNKKERKTMIDIDNLTVETAKVKTVEELDLYKEYRHAYDKATELEFFDKQQEADYYYEYAQQLKKKIDNGETTLYKVNF
jgi:ssDNA-binding replication factor A large subunit